MAGSCLLQCAWFPAIGFTSYYANGTTRFLPVFSLEPNGDLTVELLGSGNTYTLVTTNGGADYHTYTLTYDPASALATFNFDGTDIASWAGESSTQNKVLFGNGSSTTDGVANFHYVEFKIFEGPFSIFGSPVLSEQGATTDTIDVVLNEAPTDPVSIILDPDGGGAPGNNIDLGAGPGTSITLTFLPGNWSTTQTVIVQSVDDDLDEGPHDVIINFTTSSADPTFNNLRKSVTARIIDNDALIQIIESGDFTEVSEPLVSSDQYTIQLSMPPTDPVQITVDPNGGTAPGDKVDLGAGPGVPIQLNFGVLDWSTPQQVIVTAVDDNRIPKLGELVVLEHRATSIDPEFNDTITTLPVNVIENDFLSAIPDVPLIDVAHRTDWQVSRANLKMRHYKYKISTLAGYWDNFLSKACLLVEP